MANPKNRIHAGVTVAGVVVAGILALFTGGDPFALMIVSGGMSGLGYWLGAAAQRRHG